MLVLLGLSLVSFCIKPALFAQLLGYLLCLDVEYVGSNTTWNCGDTKPVVVSRTNAIVRACCGDGPKYIPIFDLAAHLLNGFCCCSSLLST